MEAKFGDTLYKREFIFNGLDFTRWAPLCVALFLAHDLLSQPLNLGGVHSFALGGICPAYSSVTPTHV